MNTKVAFWVTVAIYATATMLAVDTFVKYPRIRVDIATCYLFGLLMPLYVAKKIPGGIEMSGAVLLLVAMRTIRFALRI